MGPNQRVHKGASHSIYLLYYYKSTNTDAEGAARYIEGAILDADSAGVEVFGLGALNKNEALNGGGALFVKNNPNLRLRLVPLHICLHTATILLILLLILRPLRPEASQPPPSPGITTYVCPHYIGTI